MTAERLENAEMIDLRSDTATLPTRTMRQAIADASVGDEQHGEDPSVNALCERVADMLEQEAAVFLPSGIMCNQVSLCVHCRPGDEVLVADNAHILQSEGGATAANAQAIVTPISADRGIFTAKALENAIRPKRLRAPRPRVVSIEQSTNRGGGAVWPLQDFLDIAATVRSHDLVFHLDGARLLNAAVASGVDARAFGSQADSVWLDLTKGLGCPLGAVLAGRRAFIEEAWFIKNRLGGAMRQAGMMAAAGLHALSHHVDRLAEDHEHARLFVSRLEDLACISLPDVRIDTNIIIFDVDLQQFGREPAELLLALQKKNVRIRSEGDGRFRAVTHLDVGRDQIEKATDALRDILSAWSREQPRVVIKNREQSFPI